MENIQTKMQAIVNESVKHFKTDFTHDKTLMEKYPNLKFVWIVREMGTNLFAFHTEETLPAKGEKVKYIFGIADRHHILTNELSAFKECFKDRCNRFFIVDQDKTTIKETDFSNAVYQLENHVSSILNTNNRRVV